MNTAQYLKDNREEIISRINIEIKRVQALFGKTKCELKSAMIVYKNTLEATENAGKAIEEAQKAIKGGMRLSKYAFLSEQDMRQLPSSMR